MQGKSRSSTCWRKRSVQILDKGRTNNVQSRKKMPMTNDGVAFPIKNVSNQKNFQIKNLSNQRFPLNRFSIKKIFS